MANIQETLARHLQRQVQLKAARDDRVMSGKPKFPAPERKQCEVAPEPLQVTAAPTASKNYINRTQGEDIEDYLDAPEVRKEKIRVLADLIRNAKSCVAYTGAGISTSASIPDYRSKQGVWTMREKGMQVQGRSLDDVKPTVAHRILTDLVKLGKVAHVVSTNIDGLHMRSGLSSQEISEIHGNAFLEVCQNPKCKREYLRDHAVGNVSTEQSESQKHETGGRCDACQGPLWDAIIHFGELLPPEIQERAFRVSHAADLALCIGTSLRVSPACNMPRTVHRNGGKLVVCSDSSFSALKALSTGNYSTTDSI
jgi:NAD-dependent SIR2 family protein deacetylase